MANPKNTLNEYNKTKWELSSSTAQLAQEKKEVFGLSKDQKQVFVDMLKWWVEKDQINKIYKQTYWAKLQERKELTQKFKEDNKDLIAKYQELYTQKKLNEENLKELIKKAKELGFDNEEELRVMIMWKSDKKEAKEKIEWLPELADKNFRVENTKGWKEMTDPNGVKVLENLEWDVREYLEGDCKWEQLFTQDSALREANKAGKILPASWTTYRDIIEKKYEWNYQDFLKWENMTFPGWRHPDDKKSYGINDGFGLRCADGSCFRGSRNGWGDNGWGKNYGFSVRCLKD